MHFQAQLVHAEGERWVVLVTGWSGDQCLGSALGEAAAAEAAEDRALVRLQQRLAVTPRQASQPAAGQASPAATSKPPSRGSQGQRPGPAPAPLQPSLQAISRTAVPPAPAGQAQDRPAAVQPSLPGAQAKAARPQSQASVFPAALAAKPPAPETSAPESQPAKGPGLPATADSPAAAGTLSAQADEKAGAESPSPEEPAPMAEPGASASTELPPAASGPAISAGSSSAAGSSAAASELPADPEDWSDELAALDIQLQRLGWLREQESIYLQRAFGHPSRSRLTSYGDLVAYLAAVRQLPSPSDPASVPVPLRRVDLLAQSDQLLGQLGWDASRGREILETFFQCSSRQQLNDEDLLRFNMVLEGELITGMGQPEPGQVGDEPAAPISRQH
ncbi:MAG: hypothetical protein NTZ53_06820 [Cyanobacteria bacterium]|nr:hypothetical protein [Cyanobacteriota bacterium]